MVFLFIFESIGTSELIMIGIIALIFLGPRRLPEMARKLGKIMADFRTTTNEFKETWEREVNFEEEARAIRTGEIAASSNPASTDLLESDRPSAGMPEIRAIDASAFTEETVSAKALPEDSGDNVPAKTSVETQESPENDKKNWL